ncbi:MAG TPA: patatin-like phospholipase family protein [Acidimicrobiales bacterium]
MCTAFVFAGGASLGAIEAGMLEALYERDVHAEVFVGASAGALNAGFAATHPQTAEAARELQDAWRSTKRRDVFPLSPAIALRALLGRSDHLVSNRGLRRLLEDRLGGLESIQDARVKLGVVVTDLLAGRERLVDSGPALPALLASAAIPGIYPPVNIEGRLYVDGGVADNTPIAAAMSLGADTIYVLATGMSARLERPPAGAVAMAVQASNMLVHSRLRHEINSLRNQARLVVLPPPWPLNVLPSDFSHADELIRAGLTNAREALMHSDPGGAPTDRALACLQDPVGDRLGSEW